MRALCEPWHAHMRQVVGPSLEGEPIEAATACSPVVVARPHVLVAACRRVGTGQVADKVHGRRLRDAGEVRRGAPMPFVSTLVIMLPPRIIMRRGVADEAWRWRFGSGIEGG
jgi:hypothetical protein